MVRADCAGEVALAAVGALVSAAADELVLAAGELVLAAGELAAVAAGVVLAAAGVAPAVTGELVPAEVLATAVASLVPLVDVVAPGTVEGGGASVAIVTAADAVGAGGGVSLPMCCSDDPERCDVDGAMAVGSSGAGAESAAEATAEAVLFSTREAARSAAFAAAAAIWLGVASVERATADAISMTKANGSVPLAVVSPLDWTPTCCLATSARNCSAARGCEPPGSSSSWAAARATFSP